MVLEITQARENCGITNSLILGRDLSTSTSKFATAVSLDPLIYERSSERVRLGLDSYMALYIQ
jgi:hypothetical protein